MAATSALRWALNEGISSGNLIDTKIILYSHRDSSRRVCQPKALYATSHVLKTVPYFNDLLFGKFAESQPRDFNEETIDEAEYAEDYGYLSDSDLEDDEDGKAASIPVPNEDKTTLYEEYEERVEKGKVVKIPDMAFVTFKAFLMYFYTSAIEFAPFGSKENRRSRSAEIVALSDDNVPRPSPKSIYRLADKYDIPALKTLALNHIRGDLKKCDIVDEAFSKFASRYYEIWSLYASQLAFVWMEDSTTETTRASFDLKVDSFIRGKLEHATQMLTALWEILNKDGDITAPSNATPAVVQVTSPAHWATVKLALIRSISKGVFFDRKYWARQSNAGDVLKPVYFSSIIIGDKEQQLNSLIGTLSFTAYGETPTSTATVKMAQWEPEVRHRGRRKKRKKRLVLSLLLGHFQHDISFAPLKSQGADSRSSYIHGMRETFVPPPCSPKSIHVLASRLGIQALCDSAFADIKSKVSPDNVVGEVFSWVTASQLKIMEMQCDLLISNLKNPKVITLMKENIEHVSDGSSSYCGGALKLGFKKAFELKKQERIVLLRCSNPSCGWYTNPVPYSSVGAQVYCPQCSYNNSNYYSDYDYGYRNNTRYYMQCVGCGYQRTSNFISCQRCRKKFL